MEKITVFNRNNLIELVQEHPKKWNRIKDPEKEKWLTGEDSPTYIQLVEISKAFNIPFGYLFLNKLPEKKLFTEYCENLNDIINLLKEIIEKIKVMKKSSIVEGKFKRLEENIFKRGIKKGIEKEKLKIVEKMVEHKMDDNDIRIITGLSLKKIQELRKKKKK